MATEKIVSGSFTRHPTPIATWTTWCDSCHSLPSSVFCRADSAYLCLNCDSSIHSANSLARRHHRLPLLPNKQQHHHHTEEEEEEEDYDDGFLIAAEVDEYLDLLDFTTSDEEQGKQQHKQMLHATFTASESLSSIEATVVPENSMMSISSSQFRTSEGTIELFSDRPLQMPQQFTPMDREARVLRYREKRKTRKFQKIIRYASRKAYAETRPRIKGRFAKRTDVELAVDQMFAAPVMVESGYGVVHSY